MRLLFKVVAIFFGACFALAVCYAVAELSRNFGSGRPSELQRGIVGAIVGIISQIGLVLAPFQKTPSAAKRVVLALLMAPSVAVFALIVRQADLSRGEQQVLWVAGLMGFLVYISALVFVFTRPFKSEE